MRLLIIPAVACLTAFAATSANANVDEAIAVFEKVGADADKLAVYCDLSYAIDETEPEEGQPEPKEDPAIEAEIDGYIEKLGPEFEAAWGTADEADENSADGKRLGAALEALDAKCPEDPADGAE